MGSRLRRTAFVLAVNGLTLVVLVFVLEVASRVFTPQTLRREPKGVNEAFGRFHRPKPNLDVVDARPEGSTVWRTNSRGLRDHEIDYAKPAGTFRVVGLGDSFTFGYLVEQPETFLHQLELSLNENQPLLHTTNVERFETINMGVGGYGALGALQMLELESLKYEPDLVLWAFFAGNDVTDTARERARQKLPESERRRTLTAGERVREFLGTNLHLYSFVSVRLHELLVKLKLRSIDESTIDILRAPSPEAIDEGWTLLEDALLRMRDLCNQAGASFVVAVLPIRHQVDEREWAFIRDVYGLRPEEYDLDQPQRRLRELCQSHGVATIDLLPAFRTSGKQLFFVADGHLNGAGHRLTADVLHRDIATRLQHPDAW